LIDYRRVRLQAPKDLSRFVEPPHMRVASGEVAVWLR